MEQTFPLILNGSKLTTDMLKVCGLLRILKIRGQMKDKRHARNGKKNIIKTINNLIGKTHSLSDNVPE